MQRRHFLTIAASAGAATTLAPGSAHAFEPAANLRPTLVQVRSNYAPGSIVVVPQAHYLYWIQPGGTAMRYGVGVGRAGLEFQGDAVIARKAVWPNWRPTDEMIEREPHVYAKYADGVPGGPENPLGSRALYLYQNGIDTYYRIHGTTQPRSIGTSSSNGCIRMINAHVEDLYNRVPLGTKVTVL
jgi:lipoprotein-anchoring transpeptidase ErfK/SrfK